MKAAVTTGEKGKIIVKDIPKPQVQPGSLLLKTKCCSICGTDLEYVDDYSICLDDLVGKNHEIPKEVIHNELFFKKTSRWKHECEYRMVRPLEGHPYYQPPQTNYIYTYTDPQKYLFPFDWSIVSSIILGTNMSTKNKRQIVQCCKEHNIHLSQAHIVRDLKDRFGKPSTIITFGINEFMNEEKFLQAKPQLFCTDVAKLNHKYS